MESIMCTFVVPLKLTMARKAHHEMEVSVMLLLGRELASRREVTDMAFYTGIAVQEDLKRE
jgi:sulfopyruvate decarboxylase TPP-binding subunit